MHLMSQASYLRARKWELRDHSEKMSERLKCNICHYYDYSITVHSDTQSVIFILWFRHSKAFGFVNQWRPKFLNVLIMEIIQKIETIQNLAVLQFLPCFLFYCISDYEVTLQSPQSMSDTDLFENKSTWVPTELFLFYKSFQRYFIYFMY